MEVAIALGTVVGTCDCLVTELLMQGAKSNIFTLFCERPRPGVSSPFDWFAASRGDGADEMGIISGAGFVGDNG